jgi:ATP-dependent protease ClpP protease subunit
MVIEQSGRGERAYDIYSRPAEGTDHLSRGSRCTETTANVVVAQMLFLESKIRTRRSASTSIPRADR